MNEPNRRKYMESVYSSEKWSKTSSSNTKNQWKNTNLREKIIESNGKKVKCIETNKIYSSMTEAMKDTGIERHKISNSCKNNNYHPNNTTWKFI